MVLYKDIAEAGEPSLLDLVIEGKGRRWWQTFPSARVTAVRSFTAYGTISFKGYVENRTDGALSGKIKFNIRIPDEWTGIQLKVDGVLKDVPYEFELAGESKIDIQIDFLTATSDYWAGNCEISLIEDDGVIDMGKCVAVKSFVEVADVHKEIEMLSTSEQLFPADATYSADASIQPMIAQELDKFLTLAMDKLDDIDIRFIEMAKDYIVMQIIVRILKKAAIYTIGGEALYLRITQNYHEEVLRLEERILAGYL